MRSRRGNVLAIAAATLPLFIAAAGLATDTIQWTLWKRQLQRAADSAAIAGVYNREANGGATTGATSGTATDTTISHDLTINLHTSYALKSGFPTINYPANSGFKTDQVTVTVAIQRPLSFSSLFLSTAPTITATATAASIPAGGDACIEALDTAAANAINYQRQRGSVHARLRSLFSNSANVNAASARGSSAVTANTIGGSGRHPAIQATSPSQPIVHIRRALPDSVPSVTPDPSDMNCVVCERAHRQHDMARLTRPAPIASRSLSIGFEQDRPDGPGRLRADLHKRRQCRFERGLHLHLHHRADQHESGGERDDRNISSNAQATNNITAPTTGTYAGIAIYQDRRATGNTNKINGGSGNVIQGAIYFPKDTVDQRTGNATSLCAMWVAKQHHVHRQQSRLRSAARRDGMLRAGCRRAPLSKLVRLVA